MKHDRNLEKKLSEVAELWTPCPPTLWVRAWRNLFGPGSLVVTCWAGHLALLYCDVFLCFCHFRQRRPVLGQVWYLIVSIPDLCLFPYFDGKLFQYGETIPTQVMSLTILWLKCLLFCIMLQPYSWLFSEENRAYHSCFIQCLNVYALLPSWVGRQGSPTVIRCVCEKQLSQRPHRIGGNGKCQIDRRT